MAGGFEDGASTGPAMPICSNTDTVTTLHFAPTVRLTNNACLPPAPFTGRQQPVRGRHRCGGPPAGAARGLSPGAAGGGGPGHHQRPRCEPVSPGANAGPGQPVEVGGTYLTTPATYRTALECVRHGRGRGMDGMGLMSVGGRHLSRLWWAGSRPTKLHRKL